MRLLILTQKIDDNDPVLGFFCRWVGEFAKHYEQVTVITLGVGEYHLPSNTRVLSLGKERGVSRLGYIFNFYRLIWRERKNYDAVFVHMNQEYVLLGGLVWKLLGKKITMWRNHYAGSLLTDIAAIFCNTVFCTSKYSYTAKYKKTVLMPVGIDTELFKRDGKVIRKPNSILFLSRISPSKKPEVLIEALRILKRDGVQFTADFYGDPLPQDVSYAESLKEKVKEYGLEQSVGFHAGIPNTETPAVYSSYDIFVNTSPSGMYDKTIFEAMSCETLVLTSNKNLKGEIDDMFLFEEDDANSLAQKLQYIFTLNPGVKVEHGKMLRDYVLEKHGLARLAISISTLNK